MNIYLQSLKKMFAPVINPQTWIDYLSLLVVIMIIAWIGMLWSIITTMVLCIFALICLNLKKHVRKIRRESEVATRDIPELREILDSIPHYNKSYMDYYDDDESYMDYSDAANFHEERGDV